MPGWLKQLITDPAELNKVRAVVEQELAEQELKREGMAEVEAMLANAREYKKKLDEEKGQHPLITVEIPAPAPWSDPKAEPLKDIVTAMRRFRDAAVQVQNLRGNDA